MACAGKLALSRLEMEQVKLAGVGGDREMNKRIPRAAAPAILPKEKAGREDVCM